ncbi:Rac GTPase-activating protein 1 [Halotydeus destructor]|nr:Rac GTPase-activating protein 1 [Halotydeus destructor]
MEPPKLSIVAQFDDICRFQNTVVSSFSIYDEVIALLNSLRECLKSAEERDREIEKLLTDVRKLEINNKALDTKLKNVRYALTKEISSRDKIQKERDNLVRKLSLVKQFLEDGPESQQHGATREKVLSCLNFTHLETVQEVQDSSENSMSDLEYDKTEEEFLEISKRLSQGKRKSSGANRKSREASSPQKQKSKRVRNEETKQNDVEIAVELREETREIDDAPTKPSSPVKEHKEKENRNPARSLFRLESLYSPSRKPKHVTASTPYLQSPSTLTLTNTPQEMTRQHSNQRIENRVHTFVTKKVLRPGDNCVVCNGTIGFLSTCYKCRECRATCHTDCKDKAPVPCVPYVQNQTNRGTRLVLISDFTPKTRPMIPALIVHCCKEIESRGLDEAGLYRIPGSDREVKELKHRIIKSKNGVPSLAEVDVHVLCGVVKEFLRSLDEPLVTRVLWRDFVRDAELVHDAEERRAAIWHTVNQLPMPNRDSLAFLMAHLQRIAESPACKMPKTNLARVLGPTIVGHSIADPPTSALYEENKKQIIVMEALLDISLSQWENVFDEIYGIRDTVDAEVTRRPSFGARPMGGTLQVNGTMTPRPKNYHPTYSTAMSASKPRSLRPLF